MVYAVMSESAAAPKAKPAAENMSMSSLDGLASRISQREGTDNNRSTFNMAAEAKGIVANADNYCCVGCDTGTGHNFSQISGNNDIGMGSYKSKALSEPNNQNFEHAFSEKLTSLDTVVKSASEISTQSEITGDISRVPGQDVQNYVNELTADTFQAVESASQDQLYDTDVALEFDKNIVLSNFNEVDNMYAPYPETMADLELVTQSESRQYQLNTQQDMGETPNGMQRTSDIYGVVKAVNRANNLVVDTFKETQSPSRVEEIGVYRITTSNNISVSGIETIREELSLGYNLEVTHKDAETITHEPSLTDYNSSIYTNKELGQKVEPNTSFDFDEEDEEKKQKKHTNKSNDNKKSKAKDEEKNKESKLKKVKQKDTIRKKSNEHLRKEVSDKKTRRSVRRIKNEKQSKRISGKSGDRDSTSRRRDASITRKSNIKNSRRNRECV